MSAQSSAQFSDDDLAAYLDGRAAPELMAQVDAAVASDPVVAERLGQIKSQGDALQRAFSPLMSQGVVEIAQSAQYRKVKKTHSRIMAALCAAFLAGIIVGYWLGAA